jgi:hypothetical protein
MAAGQLMVNTRLIPADREGGDAIILIITQEIRKRRFNSGFQNG